MGKVKLQNSSRDRKRPKEQPDAALKRALAEVRADQRIRETALLNSR
jgi:hypothetical protein